MRFAIAEIEEKIDEEVRNLAALKQKCQEAEHNLATCEIRLASYREALDILHHRMGEPICPDE